MHYPTLPNAEVLALMARAKAFLFPISWEEPFGLVVAEALAAGAPVIATPRGSLPELVAHGVTGFLGETDDDLAGFVARRRPHRSRGLPAPGRGAVQCRPHGRRLRSAVRAPRRTSDVSFDFSPANLDREFPVRKHLVYFNHAAVGARCPGASRTR